MFINRNSAALVNLEDRAVRVAKIEKTQCAVCDGENLIEVLNLSALPLTGIYVERPCPEKFPPVDQVLLLCNDCGHGELRFCLDPEFVYGEVYSHRSSTSAIARQGNDFFLDFLSEVTRNRSFKRIVEIGCNDLYLLKKLQSRGEKLFGIDPIWHGQEFSSDSNVSVIGKFVEEVEFPEETEGPPDLVISAHTFEHMVEPKIELRRVMEAAGEDAIFILEVPAFDSLLRNCRFDQVFHQHLQYFSVASLLRLIQELGGHYLAHRFNYLYWGGTLLIAFQKGRGEADNTGPAGIQTPTASLVQERFSLFRREMDWVTEIISSIEGPIYGYGAAQMLPTLAYHLKSDLSFLECVLDDNPERCGLTYPNLAVRIERPASDLRLDEATVMITALDSARPILNRLRSFKPKSILIPLPLC